MEQIALESAELRAVITPAGGRIVSIVYRSTGQELLWQQTLRPDWPRYGVPEVEEDIQGWDECCPAIGPGPFPPGPWAEVANPAQGEVFALAWQATEVTRSRATMQVHGLRFPYLLQREIHLAPGGRIALRYLVSNHGSLPLPLIWSAHPLLTAPAGATIALPDGVTGALIDSSEGGRLGAVYNTVSWPIAGVPDGTSCDLRQIVPGSGWADKLYITEAPEGACSLTRADGLTLSFAWSTEQIPCLGVWIDTRGEGEARVALEPCLGYPGLMHEAAAWGRYMLLQPYEERAWELTLTVTATTPG